MSVVSSLVSDGRGEEGVCGGEAGRLGGGEGEGEEGGEGVTVEDDGIEKMGLATGEDEAGKVVCWSASGVPSSLCPVM